MFDGKNKRFPLLDTLRATAPTWGSPEFVGYEVAATPDIDREKLGYFALSVFWRASVHIWRERGEEPITLDLGKVYNKSFRQYLLGQTGFPSGRGAACRRVHRRALAPGQLFTRAWSVRRACSQTEQPSL